MTGGQNVANAQQQRPNLAVRLLRTNTFFNVANAQNGRANRRKGPKMCRCGKDQSKAKKPPQGEVEIIEPPEEEDKNAEVDAKVCDKCNRYKKPLNGKKLAWRSASGSWMSVPNSAPDEEPPESELENGEPPPENHHQLRTWRMKLQSRLVLQKEIRVSMIRTTRSVVFQRRYLSSTQMPNVQPMHPTRNPTTKSFDSTSNFPQSQDCVSQKGPRHTVATSPSGTA